MARKLITTAEFGEQVRRPEATIRYWRHVGFGPKGARVGRRVLYDQAEVDAWIESHFEAAGDQETGA